MYPLKALVPILVILYFVPDTFTESGITTDVAFLLVSPDTATASEDRAVYLMPFTSILSPFLSPLFSGLEVGTGVLVGSAVGLGDSVGTGVTTGVGPAVGTGVVVTTGV